MFRQHANGANRKSEFWCINLGSSGFAGTGCNQRKSADKLQSDVIVPYLCTSSHPGSPASCKGLFQDAGYCNLPTRYRVIPIGGPVGNRMSAATAARSTGTGSIGNRSLLIVDAQTNGRGLEFGVEEIHSSGRKIVCRKFRLVLVFPSNFPQEKKKKTRSNQQFNASATSLCVQHGTQRLRFLF